MLSSKILRMLVDDAWDEPNALTLRQQMRAFETQARQVISGGTISSTSANGRHVALTGSGPGNATQLEIAEAWRRLIDVYDASASGLGVVVDDQTSEADDLRIKAVMMAELREVYGHTTNFMYLSK